MPTTPIDPADVQALIDQQMHLEGPLLPILHALQEAYGYVPQEALPLIATTLNITKAEVHGVMSFYHDFREAPAGQHVVKICRAEACQAVGANALAERTLEKLGIAWNGTSANGTSANGAVTVEPVYCLGLCACGPAVLVDGKVAGRVDEARMEALLAEMNP